MDKPGLENIKKMYEDSILSGDVENKSFDTLLHNFKKIE